MSNGSPFSGGGGTPVDPNAPPVPMPPEISNLLGILNKGAIRRYTIDVNGASMKLSFKTDGFVTIVVGDTIMELPFTVG
jgi:hypothetical protein